MKYSQYSATALLFVVSCFAPHVFADSDTCSGAYIDTLMPPPADCTHETRTCVGDYVTLDYKGSFTNGTVFDQSFGSPDGPFTFKYGVGQVIKGFDQGLKKMCAGERRWVMIPPKFGYGEKGVPGVIPPNSTLIFEILLHEVKRNETSEHS